MEPEPYEAQLNRIDEFFEGMELELKKDINLNSSPPKNNNNAVAVQKNSLNPIAFNPSRPVPMQLESTQMIVEDQLSVIELWHETPAVVSISQNEISENPKAVIDKWMASIGQPTSKISKLHCFLQLRTIPHCLLGIDTARWNSDGTTTFITKVRLAINLFLTVQFTNYFVLRSFCRFVWTRVLASVVVSVKVQSVPMNHC